MSDSPIQPVSDFYQKYDEERRLVDRQTSGTKESLQKVNAELTALLIESGQMSENPASNAEQPEHALDQIAGEAIDQVASDLNDPTVNTEQNIPIEPTASASTNPNSPLAPPIPIDTSQTVGQLLLQPNSVATPIQPSAQGQAEIAEQEESVFTTAMKTLDFLASPLLAVGDFALAPIARPSQNPDIFGAIVENFQTAATAAGNRLLPDFGEEHPRYSMEVVNNLLPEGTPDVIKESVALTLDMVSDAPMAGSLIFRNVIKEGLEIARSERILAGEGDSFKGIFVEGLQSLFGVVDINDLGEMGKLAIRAQAGDQEAVNELAGVLAKQSDDPAATAAEALARFKEEQQQLDLLTTTLDRLTNTAGVRFNPEFEALEGMPFGPMGIDESAAAMTRSLETHSLTKTIEYDMRQMNEPEDIEAMLDSMINTFVQDYRKSIGTQTNAQTVALSQQYKLEDLIGKKANEFLPEEAYAMRMMVLSTGTTMKRMAMETLHPATKKNLKGMEYKIAKARYTKSLAIHLLAQEKATGVAAHGGRLLQSFNILPICE